MGEPRYLKEILEKAMPGEIHDNIANLVFN